MKFQSLVPLLLVAVEAAPETISAASYVGQSTSDVFPPTGTSVNSAQFPPPSKVGFAGPTPTGLEGEAAQEALHFPYNSQPAYSFPLAAPQIYGSNSTSNFEITKYWGNLAPWYSVSSAEYGLPDASPLIPQGCTIEQVHLLFTHGARYPTTGASPSAFGSKLANASIGEGFTVSGDLAFLADWKIDIGNEILVPFGRGQNFMLGVRNRMLYGELLNNFTAQKALPVFRAPSQERVVKAAENFAAGFFGVPQYLDQVNIEILVESPGVNNSGAPYETCNNSNVQSLGDIGTTVTLQFAVNAFNSTVSRLNTQVSGNLTFNGLDAIGMLQLCIHETYNIGYSPFCKLFTEEDFKNYEYFCDLAYYYNNGPGSPVGAAQGKGYLQEYVARFTQTYPAALSSLNETFDSTSTYFPLNQSIYADATHEDVLVDALMAFNLTALFDTVPLNLNSSSGKHTFVASKQVAFASHLTTQVLECPAMSPSKQIRLMLNDAVIPVSSSHPGCPNDPNGLCPFSTMVSVLQKRIAEIDYDYDCFANYTAVPGMNYNGRAPRS